MTSSALRRATAGGRTLEPSTEQHATRNTQHATCAMRHEPRITYNAALVEPDGYGCPGVVAAADVGRLLVDDVDMLTDRRTDETVAVVDQGDIDRPVPEPRMACQRRAAKFARGWTWGQTHKNPGGRLFCKTCRMAPSS